jgi:hypothetical protein
MDRNDIYIYFSTHSLLGLFLITGNKIDTNPLGLFKMVLQERVLHVSSILLFIVAHLIEGFQLVKKNS